METGRERYESNEWAKALAVKPDAMNRNTIIVYGLKVPGLMHHEYQSKVAIVRIARVRSWLQAGVRAIIKGRPLYPRHRTFRSASRFRRIRFETETLLGPWTPWNSSESVKSLGESIPGLAGMIEP